MGNAPHRVTIDKHSKCSTVVLLLVVHWQFARSAMYLVVAVTCINRQILNSLHLMKNSVRHSKTVALESCRSGKIG